MQEGVAVVGDGLKQETVAAQWEYRPLCWAGNLLMRKSAL